MGDVTAKTIIGLLEQRHRAADGWHLFRELRNGTGFQRQTRSIDALAMHLWPSKKFWRIAYEVKVNRGDWLRELAAPEKRADAADIAHEFYFVAPPGVIGDTELPEGTGLLVCTKAGDKLVKRVPARQREAPGLPEHMAVAMPAI